MHFWRSVLNRVFEAVLTPKWCPLGSILGSFLEPKRAKNHVDLRGRFRGRFWESPGTLRGPEPLKTLGGLVKIKDRRFPIREAPGSILGAKMEPKASSETQKSSCEIDAKNDLDFY